MTRQDDGFGRVAGPNPGAQSDFSKRQAMGAPSVQTWGNNALNAQPSEVSLMAQGGRPGQPAGGQRPMFGGGSPVFAPMPSYTPVTRGADLRQQMPERPSAYSPYAAQPAPYGQPTPQYANQPASGPSYPSPQPPLNYPGSFAEAAPSYQSPQPGAAPSYQNAQRVAGGYDAGANYQATDFGAQTYQPFQPAGFRNAEPQPYAASGYDQTQAFQNQNYQDQSFGDASFPEGGGDASFADASFPDTSFDQNFADQKFANQNFAKPGFGDAGFPQQQDASFPEQGFAGGESRDQHNPHGASAYVAQDGQVDQGFELFADEPAQDYGQAAPKIDPRRQLQAFDAIYDQPPQIALGSTEQARRPAQNFYEGERLDADFLDGGQMPQPGTPAKSGFSFKSRSAFMVGSALLGAIALGGALAVAYKQSGGGLGSEPPPLVQADNTPVKAAPDQPGGKEFPHNKLIYDRLQDSDAPEAEKLVPRQEEVAVPAMPGAAPGMPTPVATTDAVPPTTQALPGAAPMPGPAPVALAAADDASAEGGPRKVKTMVVRPDGSVETPAVPELPAEAAAAPAPQGMAPAEAAPAGAQLAAVSPPPAPEPQPAQAAPQEAAPQPAAEPKPKPAPKPAAQQTAAAAPQAAAGPVKYVVQVGSKKNQTEALASFADMQQKYPTLLASYRPIVQKADLGSKGTWYRLRIGPIADKTSASKLCSQLKSQGLPDCLVMAQ